MFSSVFFCDRPEDMIKGAISASSYIFSFMFFNITPCRNCLFCGLSSNLYCCFSIATQLTLFLEVFEYQIFKCHILYDCIVGFSSTAGASVQYSSRYLLCMLFNLVFCLMHFPTYIHTYILL